MRRVLAILALLSVACLGVELKSDADDITLELQKLLKSEREVVIPARGEPYIVSERLFMSSNQTLILKAGVVLEAAPDRFHAKNDEFLTLEDLENVRICGYGAEIRMRKADYQDAQRYTRSEWRHGIAVRDCRNVTVEGITVRSTGGDGMYIGTKKADGFSQKIVVKDCVFDDNHRQGISVISADGLLVEHCVVSNTIGTDPESGIDFEPNSPKQRLTDCVVRNTLAYNNHQLGFHGWLKNVQAQTLPVSIRFENCTAVGGQASAHVGCVSAGGRGRIEFVDCIFTSPSSQGIRLRDKDAKGVELYFKNCMIHNVGQHKYTSRKGKAYNLNAPIAIFTIYKRSETPGGVHFENCTVFDAEERPAIVIADPIDFAAEGFSGINGTLNVSTPSKEAVQLYGTRLDDASKLEIRR